MTGFEGPLPPKTGDGSAATAQSLKAGIAPSHASLTELGAIGLGAVFFTHLHRQQLASLGDFREPVECLVGHAERPAGSLRFLYSNPLPFAARIQELSFEKAQELAPLGPCMDILGDGSLWAISTPGHTIGSVSYLVMDAKGPILVAGLLATGLRGPRSAANCGRHRELGRFSLQRLHEFLDLHPSVRLAPSLTGLIPAAPRTESGAGVASGSVDDDEFVGGRFE
jgi:glyoxylase-like metal-dependent hydrolase (beta-lactamase superfamily II)